MSEVILASSSTRRRIWISEMLEGAGVDLSFFDLRVQSQNLDMDQRFEYR